MEIFEVMDVVQFHYFYTVQNFFGQALQSKSRKTLKKAKRNQRTNQRHKDNCYATPPRFLFTHAPKRYSVGGIVRSGGIHQTGSALRRVRKTPWTHQRHGFE